MSDLVIEAVFEDMAVKKEVFAKLDAVCKPGAVLATNTSYLDVDEIAAATARPADVIGLHFFSPAHVMKLLEVVVADETAPDVVATGFALGKRLGKISVRAGVCDGFIGNRILAHLPHRRGSHGARRRLALPDRHARWSNFGFAMGPFAVADLAGLDIGWATRKRKAPHRAPRRTRADLHRPAVRTGAFRPEDRRGLLPLRGGQPRHRTQPENPRTDRRRAGEPANYAT